MKNSVYYTFKDYLVEKYGAPYYRVPIDLALSCPHRNKNNDGCIFCAEDGARAVHLSKYLDLHKQVLKSIEYAEKRYNAEGRYIAYFQSYTNTNSDVATLRKLYNEVLNSAKFKIVIISTRPDCLSDDIISFLDELNQKYDVWVELGVQSANDKTLDKINRGHNFAAVKDATTRLHQAGIKTVAHIIIGLPDEVHKDYVYTITELNKLPFTAYKIHHLILLKNSPLARHYNKANISQQSGSIEVPDIGTIKLLNEFEYAGYLIDLIRRIPKNRPLLRLTADAMENNIIGPHWNLSKGQFLELVKNTMLEKSYSQGDLLGKIQKSTNNISDINSPLSPLKVKTNDNSFTFYSPKYRENYHSIAGAASEAEHKFIAPSKLKERLNNTPEHHLLDVGFGLGYNALAALKTAIENNAKLYITTLEMDINTLQMGITLHPKGSLEYSVISALLKNNYWTDGHRSIKLIPGDARKAVLTLKDKIFDTIFLDAFSPQKNPELWTYDFIKCLSEELKESGILVTYSSAFPVRGALLKTGMYVGETKAFGRKKGGTIASKQQNNITNPLSEKEMNIMLKSTAGTPYRDHHLSLSSKKIFSYRDNLTRKLRQKGIPKWWKEG